MTLSVNRTQREFDKFVDVTGETAVKVSVIDTIPTGGGTEYTEGDVDASITGGAMLAEAPSNTLEPLQLDASNNLKVAIQGTPTVALDAVSLTALEDINVTITVAPEIEIKNDSGNPIPISDNGGSLTVDGTITTINEVVSTSTLTNVSGSATSVGLLASTAGRKMAMFFNDSTASLYLKLGATASTSSFTVLMRPYDYYELPQPIYTGAIDGIWDSATGAVRITELT